MKTFGAGFLAIATFLLLGVLLAEVGSPEALSAPVPVPETPLCEPVPFDYGTFCPNIEGFDAMVREAAVAMGHDDADFTVATVKQESRCNETVLGDGGDAYGLTQIHPRWWRGKLIEEGIIEGDDDLLDAHTNLMAMAHIVAEMDPLNLYHTAARWNGGVRGMNNKRARAYAEEVMGRRTRIRDERQNVEGSCGGVPSTLAAP